LSSSIKWIVAGPTFSGALESITNITWSIAKSVWDWERERGKEREGERERGQKAGDFISKPPGPE
jgi:hypothetical protein